MSRVIFDEAALDALFLSPDGPIGKDLVRRTIRGETAAKRICPVDTGRLRASITHENGADARGLFGRIGTNVEYSVFVELGTSRMHARPYLRPGLAAAVR